MTVKQKKRSGSLRALKNEAEAAGLPEDLIAGILKMEKDFQNEKTQSHGRVSRKAGQKPKARRDTFGGRLPFRDTTLIAGRSGSNKSTLVMDLAVALATGKGHCVSETAGQAPIKGPVLYFAFEDDPEERLFAMEEAIGYNGGGIEYSNVMVPKVNKNGEEVYAPSATTLDSVTLTIKEWYDDKVAWGEQPVAVFIDPVLSIMLDSGQSAESRLGAMIVLYTLKKLARELDLYIVLVTHMNKLNESQKGGDAATGSRAWIDHNRSVLLMGYGRTREGEIVDGVRLLVHDKCNAVKEQETLVYDCSPKMIEVELNSGELIKQEFNVLQFSKENEDEYEFTHVKEDDTITLKEERVNMRAQAKQKNRQLLENVIKHSGSNGCTITEMESKVNVSTKTLQRYRSELIAMELIEAIRCEDGLTRFYWLEVSPS